MPKKTRTITPDQKPHTAEGVLTLIDSLPPAELSRLFERLVRHPQNKPLRDRYQDSRKLIDMSINLGKEKDEMHRIRSLIARGKHLQEMLLLAREHIQTTEESLRAQANLAYSVPKRGMSKERLETAEAYRDLRNRHAKEITARRALVKLPGEHGKPYAKKYRESGDDDALRNYLKSLMVTYRRHLERARMGELSGPEGETTAGPARRRAKTS